MIEFMECRTCREKLGSPVLCEACLHNRTLTTRLTEIFKQATDMLASYPRLPEAVREELQYIAGVAEGSARVSASGKKQISMKITNTADVVRDFLEECERKSPVDITAISLNHYFTPIEGTDVCCVCLFRKSQHSPEHFKSEDESSEIPACDCTRGLNEKGQLIQLLCVQHRPRLPANPENSSDG